MSQFYNQTDIKTLPVPKGGAKFRLVNLQTDENGRYMAPSKYSLPPAESLIIKREQLRNFDKETEDAEEEIEVIMEYFTSAPRPVQDPVSKVVTLQGTRGYVQFIYGFLHVKDHETNLYNVLMRSNHRKDNPDAIPGKVVIFELVDDKAIATKADKLRRTRISAINLAYEMPHEELVEYGRALQMDVSLSEDELRMAMASYAENSPEAFIKGSDSADRKFKALINLCLEKGIIEYSPGTKEWFRLDKDETGKVIERHLIKRIPQPEDGYLYFVKALIKDSSIADLLYTLSKGEKPEKKGTSQKKDK